MTRTTCLKTDALVIVQAVKRANFETTHTEVKVYERTCRYLNDTNATHAIGYITQLFCSQGALSYTEFQAGRRVFHLSHKTELKTNPRTKLKEGTTFRNKLWVFSLLFYRTTCFGL
jgi:hypothetical protein